MKGLNKSILIGVVIAAAVVAVFFGTSLLTPVQQQAGILPPTIPATGFSAKQASDTVISVSSNIDEITATLEDINSALT